MQSSQDDNAAVREEAVNRAKLAAASAKDVLETVKEYSIMARETSRALRESGAIPELVVTAREIASVVRDISAEIRATTATVKESGVPEEIAADMRESVEHAKATAQIAKETATSTKETFETSGQKSTSAPA